jgi:DNA polymerase-3 subunit epsilon
MGNGVPVRQVAIDIETTGLEATNGHRVIEIAAVELIDRRISGRSFHTYVNPKRDVDLGAQAVHGLTPEFLQDKPEFFEIATAFLSFVRGAELIAHNAPFDLGFLNGELALKDLEHLEDICPRTIDTLELARAQRPEQSNSLSALCEAFGIEIPEDGAYGALLDAELLAQVYLVLSQRQLH